METMDEKSSPEKLEKLENLEKFEMDKDQMDKVDKTVDMDTVEEVVIKDPMAVEEVVIKDPIAVDTTDKKAQYRQSNTFAAKKTVAQGMMDVALITANANQLRYLLEYQQNSNTFVLILSLIIISLSLQVAVGISLVFKGRFDIKGKSKSNMANKINNYVVVGVFLITIINVFIASFSISVQPSVPT